MLEIQKVDNNKIRKALFYTLEYVIGTRYFENIPEVEVCRNSVVNK